LRQREALKRTVEDSLSSLDARRVDYFAQVIARKEQWRAASHFPALGYLDIETDGGFGAHSVTVIGLYDGCEMRAYWNGHNLAQFAYDCQEFDGFVTFFGTGFDLPFLRRRFPVLDNVFADRLHIDLCPLLKRLGHSGGLKRIEEKLRIPRVPESEGLSGNDAVRLWRHWQRGGKNADDALRLLLAYNREDCVNMKLLLDYALPKMHEATGFPAMPPERTEPGARRPGL
jgi:uncharacterized protein YprB with RNaseH-like and TPR domain